MTFPNMKILFQSQSYFIEIGFKYNQGAYLEEWLHVGGNTVRGMVPERKPNTSAQ